MKQIIIDTETTNFMPYNKEGHEVGQVLTVGATILETTKPFNRKTAPRFHVYIKHEHLVGSPGAIAMNAEIIKHIAENKPQGLDYGWASSTNYENVLSPDNFMSAFTAWLERNGVDIYKAITLGGKNVAGFDLPFLKTLPRWDELRTRHRMADPAALFFNPLEDDTLPDLQTCMERAGVVGNVTHLADEDALDTAEVLSIGYQRLYALNNPLTICA